MAYAIFKTGGKQYRVTEGDTIDVERLGVAEGAETVFEDVLMVADGSKVMLGDPIVEGAKITAEVVSQHRGKKVTAFKFKRRTGYHRTVGHRRALTRLSIKKISA